MSKPDLENYPSGSPRGAKLKCTTEVCELYGGGKQKIREREQGKEDDVSLRKKKSKEVASRSRKQQQSNNDSVEQSNVDEIATEREMTSRSGSMKKSKKSSKHPVPENENTPANQKDKKTPKLQEEKIVKVYTGETADSAETPVKQAKAPKEKALSKSFKKQMKEKEKNSVNKGKHTEHEKEDDAIPRRGKVLQSGPPIAATTEVERSSTSEKKIQKESKLDRKEKEKENNNSLKKKEANTKELLASSSVTPQPQPKQSNMRSVTGGDIEKPPTNSNKLHHNSDDYQNHFNTSSKEFISTKTQEFYFDNPNSNDVRENHEVMEEFSTLRPKHQESRKTVRNPSYSASTKTINVEKLLQDDDETFVKENKVDKRQMDPRTNDLDELVQIPFFGMTMNIDDARIPTPATACASTMTTRPRKVIRNKPSPNNSSSSNNNNNINPTSNNTSNTSSSQGKASRTKTSGKSSSKASRKHSRIDGAKNGGGNSSVNSNVLVNGTKQSNNTSEYENTSTINQSQHQHLQQAPNQSQSGIKHSKSQHQQQQRQNQHQMNQNSNIIMGNEILGSSNNTNVTSSGKNHIREPSMTMTSSSLKPSVQNSSSFRRRNHTGPPTVDRVRKWRKAATEKEKEYTTSAEILAAVQQQLALADLNHGSQEMTKPLHNRFNPTIYNLQSKLDKNNTMKGGRGVNGTGQINYSTNNNNNNVNLNSLVATSPPVRTPLGKSSRLIHPNLRKMSRISHFYANNGSIANSNTNSNSNNNNNTGGVINIPGGGILTLPTRGGKFSSASNKRNGASLKLNNSLSKREQSLKNVERGPKKIDSWNYHGHSRDVTSDSGTVIDIRKELKGLWYGGGVKEFSF